MPTLSSFTGTRGIFLLENRDAAVKGRYAGTQKCKLGYGTMLSESFRKSVFTSVGKRKQVVIPDIALEIK
jgi:hypothetical protein